MLNSKTFSSKRTSKRSAFTLIELSIVLIIIGLLVAGVTGGASLIRSAQLRSVMSEARGFNVAVNAFVVQYDELPGDYGTAIGSPASNGNQDGQISYLSGLGTGNGSILEGVLAWNQLINSGTIDETITPVTIPLANAGSSPVLTIGTHIPDSKFDGLGWVFDYVGGQVRLDTAAGALQADSGALVEDRNVVIATGGDIAAVTGSETTDQNFVPVAAMTPTDALSIDAKLDDGDPDSGRVRVPENLVDAFAEASPVATLCAVDDNDTDTEVTDTTYNTASSDDECALEFTVDIS